MFLLPVEVSLPPTSGVPRCRGRPRDDPGLTWLEAMPETPGSGLSEGTSPLFLLPGGCLFGSIEETREDFSSSSAEASVASSAPGAVPGWGMSSEEVLSVSKEKTRFAMRPSSPSIGDEVELLSWSLTLRITELLRSGRGIEEEGIKGACEASDKHDSRLSDCDTVVEEVAILMDIIALSVGQPAAAR